MAPAPPPPVWRRTVWSRGGSFFRRKERSPVAPRRAGAKDFSSCVERRRGAGRPRAGAPRLRVQRGRDVGGERFGDRYGDRRPRIGEDRDDAASAPVAAGFRRAERAGVMADRRRRLMMRGRRGAVVGVGADRRGERRIEVEVASERRAARRNRRHDALHREQIGERQRRNHTTSAARAAADLPHK